MTALYLHVPFCRSKCRYCSFASMPGRNDLFASYVEALRKELTALGEVESSPIESIFLGGGTPTILPAAMLTGVLDLCRKKLTLSSSVEITVEANPGTVSVGYLRALARAGVNRLSLGVQSFIDAELQKLGRVHSAAEAMEAILAARNAGFINISLDLMSGLPDQTAVSWQETLERAIALKPKHLSIYQLTIEDGTPFARLAREGQLALPAEEEILEMDRLTLQMCASAGLQHYEISNYAEPGFQCRHNLNYWENGEYLACGASAVSYRAGVRAKRVEDVGSYIQKINAGLPVVVESETLSADSSFRETVIMGLRLTQGVSRESLMRRYGIDFEKYYGETLARLCRHGLVELSDSRLRLTDRGLRLANQVMAELV